jgi:aminotransferase
MAELGAADDFELAKKLIEVTGVATVPGSSFYADPQKGRYQVRFCFCKKMETLEKAGQGLARLNRQ